MNFCRRCGSVLSNTKAYSYECAQGHKLYLNPAPTVGVFLFDTKGDLLLSVRGIEPHKGTLDAFGGFIDGPETLERALQREMREELGLEPTDYSEPVFISSAGSSYHFGSEDLRVLSMLFYAQLRPGAEPIPQDDVAEIRRVKLHEVDPADIGNDDIRQGLLDLRALLSN